MDLVIRWGGMRRLSGFLPVQAVYADFYVVDRLWPDFEPEDFQKALAWYQKQDITRGGLIRRGCSGAADGVWCVPYAFYVLTVLYKGV